ncbi:MAG: carbohydrate kinase family protein [Thermomicrobiales bacterium]
MAAPALDLVAIGSAVIDYIHHVTVLPRPDEGVFILERRVSPGGVEGNVAVAAAALGLGAGMIAHIGTDEPGRMILADFQERGVDVSRMQIGGDGDTAYSLVFVDDDGARFIMSGGRGVRGLTLDDDDLRFVGHARCCFASGYLPWPHLSRVAQCCRDENGPLFAFDLPGTFADLSRRGLRPEHLDAIVPDIDLFLADRASLRSYTGEEDPIAGLRVLRDKGVSRAVVSDGKRGLHLLDCRNGSDDIHSMPAFAIEAVDTTGAGDVLHAALIAEWLLAGRPARAAARFAAAAAALVCRDWGVRTALPSREEAEALASRV